MAYLDQLTQLQQITYQQRQQFVTQLGITPQKPYASFYPEWETTTPQYQTPSAYSLAQLGFRTNELAYTCSIVRSQAISEATLRVYDTDNGELNEITDHPLRKLLKNPTPGLSEQEFWQIVETYLCIAGFSAWEKEYNLAGEVINLWPMRPDWCSYIRGQQKPIAAIRYQPYGMQFADIPIEDVVLFQYFDPLYPMLKGFSPLMVALDLVDTDNTATRTIRQFLSNGNFLGGVLKTEQVLSETEANRAKEKWRQTHGGSEHAGEIAVMGSGLTFTPTAQTFSDATFPELDARSEARICMVYRVPPMLIGAKIGMDRSTYSNYKEARAGFYESFASSEWRFLAGQVAEQLLPNYHDGSTLAQIECKFDLADVKALQENRTEQINRAVNLYKNRVGRLNEARKEAGLNPVDGADGDNFYEAVSVRAQNPVDSQGDVEGAAAVQEPAPAVEPKIVDPNAAEEIKNFRAFAKRRIREGKIDMLASYEFKYISLDDQDKLIAEFGHQTEIITLAQSLNALAEKL